MQKNKTEQRMTVPCGQISTQAGERTSAQAVGKEHAEHAYQWRVCVQHRTP